MKTLETKCKKVYKYLMWANILNRQGWRDNKKEKIERERKNKGRKDELRIAKETTPTFFYKKKLLPGTHNIDISMLITIYIFTMRHHIHSCKKYQYLRPGHWDC